MNKTELPKTYRGYSTAELLDMLAKVSGGLREGLKEPPDKIIAMRDLAWEYRLTPEAQAAAGIISFKNIAQKGLPFQSRIPNAESRKAIAEARAGIGLKPTTLEGLKKMWDEA